MKSYKIASVALAALLGLAACGDLDTEPMDRNVTSEQKGQAMEANPEMAAAGVSGIFATTNIYMGVYSSAHCDFGWSATMFGMEAAGEDMVTMNTGYNWFQTWAGRNFGNSQNYANNLSWYTGYKIVNAANTVLQPLGDEITNPQLQLYAAQALGMRAFVYFNLAQLFQHTYVGNENEPCIPVITENNAAEAGSAGCPRSTVAETYEQILSDLDRAITYLSECGLTPTAIAQTASKRYISLGTAYGLRARVNLVMNNWAAAAADARAAINTGEARPATVAEVSRPTFGSIDEPNWLWGNYLNENDRVVTSGIVNWSSFMGSLNYGYAQAGAYVRISKKLYDSIDATDVRLGWFCDENTMSANLTEAEMGYLKAYGFPGYTQVKFMAYGNKLGTTTNANDIPMMRVEEMYLIEAEAKAHTAPGEAAQLLTEFVSAYRNPEFSIAATDTESIVEEVWHQRRIELWGEGFSYYDLLRLNKGIDRRGAGFTSEWVYDIPAPLPSLLIPEREMQNNKLIQANNESWSAPQPVV